MSIQRYVKLALEFGANNAVEFCIEDIIFDSRVLLKCMFGCSNYGYGHTCPSRTGSLSPWEYERVFKNYKKGIIIHSIDKKVSQDVSYEIERQAFFDGYHLAFSLSDCVICSTCAGTLGNPCVNKKKARPAFHSVGIDVFETVKKFGLPLSTLKEMGETQNWYSAVFIK